MTDSLKQIFEITAISASQRKGGYTLHVEVKNASESPMLLRTLRYQQTSANGQEFQSAVPFSQMVNPGDTVHNDKYLDGPVNTLAFFAASVSEDDETTVPVRGTFRHTNHGWEFDKK